MKTSLPTENIERRIYLIRGHKVMLDRDLAGIYGVSTARLNEQVKRNEARFPMDFMFQLSTRENGILMSQIATSRSDHGGHRKLPRVFTEHGAVAAAFILNSPVAVNASIQVVRAFVKLREMISSHKELTAKLEELERRLEGHDENIRSLFDAIRDLMEPPEKPKKQIGFLAREK